jgi:hypothetical protein
VSNEIVERLDALIGEVRKLREAIENGAPRRRADLDVRDRRALDRLLPVVAAQFPGEFAVWELLDTVAAGGVSAEDMRIALGRMSAHHVGKLLRRAADHGDPVAGHRVVSVARGRWRLVADPSAFSSSAPQAKFVIA